MDLHKNLKKSQHQLSCSHDAKTGLHASPVRKTGFQETGTHPCSPDLSPAQPPLIRKELSEKESDVESEMESELDCELNSARGSVRSGELADSEGSSSPCLHPSAARRLTGCQHSWRLSQVEELDEQKLILEIVHSCELRNQQSLSTTTPADMDAKRKESCRSSGTEICRSQHDFWDEKMWRYLIGDLSYPDVRASEPVTQSTSLSSSKMGAESQEIESEHSSDEYETDLEDRFPPSPTYFMDVSGKSRYLSECQKREVAPISIFLRGSRDDKLNLRYYNPSPQQMDTLSIAFLDNTYITHLDLSYNQLETQRLLTLAACLKDNQHMTIIELECCFLGRQDGGSRAVSTLVQASNNIHELNISRNCFATRDYIWLAQLLRLKSRLYKLDLSENELGPWGVQVFADALLENRILVDLNLSWNPLLTEGGCCIFKKLVRNRKMAILNVSRIGLCDQAEDQIYITLRRNRYLKFVDLRTNRLSLPVIRRLKRNLKKKATRTRDVRL